MSKGQIICRVGVAFVAFAALIGCAESKPAVYVDFEPLPPPFEHQTLSVEARHSNAVYYDLAQSDFAEGSWCLEYEADLVTGSDESSLDVDSYISVPTGERKRQVTINTLNSPISGRFYADAPGRYALVISNGRSLLSKTVNVKTRMYFPC